MPEPIPTTNEELMREFFDTNSLAEHIPPEEWQGVETEDDDQEPEAEKPTGSSGGMSDAERSFIGAAEVHVKGYRRRDGTMVKPYLRNIVRGLDPQEKAVLTRWRAASHGSIVKGYGEDGRPESDEAKLFDRAVRKLPPESGVVYRGINMRVKDQDGYDVRDPDEVADALRAQFASDPVQWNRPVSTSTDQAAMEKLSLGPNARVIFKISSDRLRNVNPFGFDREAWESELVLLPGQYELDSVTVEEFKVTDPFAKEYGGNIRIAVVNLIDNNEANFAEFQEHLHPRGVGGKFVTSGSYRGQHTAPDTDFGASLDQIDRMVVDDNFYEHLHRYYDGGQNNPTRADLESAAAIRSARGKPDMNITIYRAVPPEVDEINAHDWVTLSKAYAREHIESNGEPDWKIISRKVPVRELWWDANSLSEFGWVPGAQAGVNMAADWREDLHPRGRGGRFRSKPKFFDYVSDALHKGDVVSMDNRPDEPTYGRMDLIEAARAKGTLWDQVGKYSAADIMRVHGQLPEWAPSIHWDYGSDDQSYFIAPWEEPGSRVRGKPPRKFNDPMIGMHPLLVYPDMYKRGGVGSEDFDGKAQIKQQHKHIEGILNHELGHYMDYQILSRLAGTDIGGNLVQRMNSLAEVSEAIVRENRDGEDLGFDNVLGEVLDSLMSQDLAMRGLEKPDEHLSNDELISRYKERVVSTGMPDVFQAIEDSDWRKGINDMLDGDWITENIIKPVYQSQGTTAKGYQLADQISHYTDYLGTASEEWAQAYQQFVAEFLAREFGDDRLRKDMIADAKERAKAKVGPGAKTLGISQEVMDRVAKIHARRWDDDDFEPIYQAMYRMFDHAGMLNGLRGQQKLFAERS